MFLQHLFIWVIDTSSVFIILVFYQHYSMDDVNVLAALVHLGLNLQVINQPANSPDLNVNDLGFFHSLQTMHLRTPKTTTMQLKEMVEKVY
jgi:hypothetical protein